MLSMLISLLVLVLICAIVWWILSMIPIPAQFRWVVNVIFAIILPHPGHLPAHRQLADHALRKILSESLRSSSTKN